MDIRKLSAEQGPAILDLFTTTFSASESPKEGQLVGGLANELASAIDDEDIFCFGAHTEEELTGAIFFTRLRFAQDTAVFMLAPVAVSKHHQNQGIGQALIRHGLAQMAALPVSVITTYGDPAYYSRFGFQPLPESVLQAPLNMSMPQGWQGLSLTDQPIPHMSDRPRCVDAFDDPAYW